MNIETAIKDLDKAEADVREAQDNKMRLTEEVTKALVGSGRYNFLRIDLAKMRREVYARNKA